MFYDDSSLFNLIFADLEDDYYTETYIKLNFISFLRFHLMKDGYIYLCFIEETPFTDDTYRVITAGGMTRSMLEQSQKNRSYLRRHFFKSDSSREHSIFEEASSFSVDGEKLCRYLTNIIGQMSSKQSIALVCPINVFSRCCDDEAKKLLASRKKNPNHNIIILTGSVNAAKNDFFFRGIACQDARPDNIFCDARIFPNIDKKYKNGDRLTKLVFTYDFLKEAFGRRMKVLNDLSYEKLCFAVRYVIMHNPRLCLKYSSEHYAAVIFAWYESKRFRELYNLSELPKNTFRSFKPITEALTCQSFYTNADIIIESELERPSAGEAGGAMEIAEFWSSGSSEDDVADSIVYDDAFLKENGSDIYQYLRRFKECLKKHRGVLGTDESKTLEKLIRCFGRPSYPLYTGTRSRLPHERFGEYGKQINKLFLYLRKESWNGWDETAARLLLVLFERCLDNAKETDRTTEDRDNTLGKVGFQKCLDALAFCQKNSRRFPTDRVSADCFYDEIKELLYCEDPRYIRNYHIGELR